MPRTGSSVSLVLVAAALAGCATLSRVTALRRVDFSLDGVRDGRLAGVDLARIARYHAGVRGRTLALTFRLVRSQRCCVAGGRKRFGGIPIYPTNRQGQDVVRATRRRCGSRS